MKGNLTMKTLKHKMLFSILILAAIFTQSAFAQYFLKSYDFPPYMSRTDVGRSIEKTSTSATGSGWSIAGFSNSTPSAGDFDWMYLKLNSTGSVICSTLLGFPLGDSCFSHVKFNDASKRNVLAGFYRSLNGKEKASWSMLDSNCNHLFSKQILDSLRHQYRQVVVNPSNSFTNAGFIQYFMGGMTPNKILVTQYNSAGVLTWGFKYITPGPSTDEAYTLCYQSVDGSYAVAGRTNYPSGAGFNVFVLKLSPAGFPIWNKIYKFPGLAANSNAYRIIAMPDGGYVIAGWTNAFDPASNDIWIFRINAAGIPMWSFTYGLPGVDEESFSIVYNLTDNSLALSGHTNISGSEDILLGKLNAAGGAPLWFTKYTNPAGYDRGYDIENELAPSGYSLTGQVFVSSSASLDAFLMRADALGKVTPGCLDTLMLPPRPSQLMLDSMMFNELPVQDVQIQPQVIHPSVAVRNLCVLTGTGQNQNYIPKEFSLKQNYPNPFNPSTKIEFSLPVDGKISIKIFDASGKEIAVLINEHKNKGNYSLEFNASNLPSGVYFYKLQAEGFSDTKKMVLIK